MTINISLSPELAEFARADLKTAQSSVSTSETRVREITFAEGNARKALSAADRDVARLQPV